MVRTLLVLAGLGAIPAGLWLSRPMTVHLPPPERPAGERRRTVPAAPGDSLTVLLVDHDPFRADRVPAPVAFSPDPIEPSSSPPPSKPVLLLSGIVWGAEPSAIIEGLPGIEGGHLMRPGDVAAGIKLRRITASQIVLAGMDTTWTLSVRRPW